MLQQFGGLHSFMGWKRGMLTDSGGFQMVSLLDLADITEEGVTFQSPTTGERMLLTPERSMAIQNSIGADIMMALDDVVSSVHVGPERFEEATHRTLRWIDRCIASHQRPTEQARPPRSPQPRSPLRSPPLSPSLCLPSCRAGWTRCCGMCACGG